MSRWTHRIRHASRARAWSGVAQHAGWDARSLLTKPAEPELTWRVPDQIRPELLVLWPRRYSDYAQGWLEPIRRGVRHQVRVHYADIPQPAGNVVVWQFRRGDTTLRVGVDFDDRDDLHAADDVDLCFKMQYRRGGYGLRRVVPGGYVCKKLALYRHTPRWRAFRAGTAARHDVFGRFGLEHGAELRIAVLRLMRGQRRFRFTGGTARTTWWEHTQDLCRAKVCLDAPGRGEFSYRLVEALAVGACVVGPELGNELHVPLEAGVHHVRVDRDLDGLVEACDRLVHDGERRIPLAAAAADYFDRYLQPVQLGGYYLQRCCEAVEWR